MPLYKRLCLKDLEKLADIMSSGERNLANAAMELGVDPSGLRKTILKYRVLEPQRPSLNQCGKRMHCKLTDACRPCPYRTAHECWRCKRGCNAQCEEFQLEPDCGRVNGFPYCCNGCPKRQCRLSKFRFYPAKAWEEISSLRSEARKGPRLSEERRIEIAALVAPLVKKQGQSLRQIHLAHAEELGVSLQTLYNYVDRKWLPGIINLDLRKKAKYKPRPKEKAKSGTVDPARLKGRTYDDFVRHSSEHPEWEVVEMDTVLGPAGKEACVLTLLFRKSNHMLAFLLPRKTSSEVAKAFAGIREALGNDLFAETFRIILTDNGSEFLDPLAIELEPGTTRKLARLFYCEPGRSGQKGKLEKNHVELRKVFPKGTDFGAFTQRQLNLALRHINSEPRGNLNGNCPGEVARAFLNEKVLGLNEYRSMPRDKVNLTPGLVK